MTKTTTRTIIKTTIRRTALLATLGALGAFVVTGQRPTAPALEQVRVQGPTAASSATTPVLYVVSGGQFIPVTLGQGFAVSVVPATPTAPASATLTFTVPSPSPSPAPAPVTRRYGVWVGLAMRSFSSSPSGAGSTVIIPPSEASGNYVLTLNGIRLVQGKDYAIVAGAIRLLPVYGDLTLPAAPSTGAVPAPGTVNAYGVEADGSQLILDYDVRN